MKFFDFKLYTVAANTSRELIRDKILYILLFFAIALLALSLLLSELSANQNLRLTVDFGFSCILLSICTMTLFIGATLVFREIDKKTILFLMSYPITRSQFLIGKFFGFVHIILFLLVGLGLMLCLTLFSLGWTYHVSYSIALYGIFLEMLILLSFTILLGTVIRPFLVVGCGVGIFLIGHGINGFYNIAHGGKNAFLRHLSTVLIHIFPNLENMNWMNNVIYNQVATGAQIFSATMYSIGWTLFFLILATVAFRRRDFV